MWGKIYKLANTGLSLSLLHCDCTKRWIDSVVISSVAALGAFSIWLRNLKWITPWLISSYFCYLPHNPYVREAKHKLGTHTGIVTATLLCTPLSPPVTLTHSLTVSVLLLFRWSCWVRICAVFSEGDCVFWECMGSTAGQWIFDDSATSPQRPSPSRWSPDLQTPKAGWIIKSRAVSHERRASSRWNREGGLSVIASRSDVNRQTTTCWLDASTQRTGSFCKLSRNIFVINSQ